MDVGPAELIIVLLIVLLIFGGAKLPSLARSMGQAAHEFRKGLRHDDNDDAPEPKTEAKTEPETGSKTDANDASSPNVDA
jgi:sec-independent protein translocase protein TatA